MKILLVDIIDESRGGIERRYPPLGLGYLAAYGKKRNKKFEYRIVQCGPESIEEEVTNELFLPDVVGFTFVTQNAMLAVEAVKVARRANDDAVFVAGGQHVSVMPWWLGDASGVTVTSIVGEGEKAFYEFCCYLNGRGNIRDIDGLVYPTEEEFVFNDDTKPLELEKIQFPDITKFFFLANEVQIFTSRGCPYKCTFCSSSKYWGKPRRFSTTSLARYIKKIYDIGYRDINIYDDLFAIDKKRIRELIYRLKPYKLKDLKFSCLGRAERIDHEMAQLLKELGVRAIAFGLESGSNRVLKEIKGPTAGVAQNHRAVELVSKAGILPVGSVVYGMPSETYDEAMDTVKMIEELPLTTGEGYLATPFPGSSLWNEALSKDIISEDMDFSRLRLKDWNDNAVIVSEHMDVNQLREIESKLDEAFGGK